MADTPSILLPKPEDLIRHMEDPRFWDHFFWAFLMTVHPAEFAVRVLKKGNGQKEEALSAAFQRTFFLHRHTLKLDHWVPVLEAPVLNQNKKYRWCDLTFTPWISEMEGASWRAAADSDQHVRIEVKWHEDASGEQITACASRNESRQHFVIALDFCGEDYKLPFEEGADQLGADRMRCIYAKIRPRLGAEFKSYVPYTHLSFFVLRTLVTPTQGQ